MARKKQIEQAEPKPGFNSLRSLKDAGASVGSLVLGLVIIVLAPILWVFLLGKVVRDAIGKAFEARAQKRFARHQKAADKA